MRTPPASTSILSRLYSFIQAVFGFAPRRLPSPPILSRPKLPPPVKVVATRTQHSPWDDLMDIGPEERTTLLEAPRFTDPGFNRAEQSAAPPAHFGAQPAKPGAQSAQGMRLTVR